MFIRMLRAAFFRQPLNQLLLFTAVTLSVTALAAMLNLLLGAGEKLNRELKSYGANITLAPKASALLSDEYEGALSAGYIKESDLLKIKNIFWAHNIVDFAPFLNVETTVKGVPVTVVGTWFSKEALLPNGTSVKTGIKALKPWWSIMGGYPIDGSKEELLIGRALAEKLSVETGDKLKLGAMELTVTGIFSASEEEEASIYLPLEAAQTLSGAGKVFHYAEISAITTPENELARKAEEDVRQLTTKEYDTWYCTAYISSIIHQIEEELPGTKAKAVLRISKSEGVILNKFGALLLVLTVLCLAAALLSVSTLITSKVMRRRPEIGLIKAIGAENYEIVLLFLTETLIVALFGGAFGAWLGGELAKAVSLSVFKAKVTVSCVSTSLSLLAAVFMAAAGSIPTAARLLKLEPAETLR